VGKWGNGVLDISGIVVALLILAVWVVVVLAAGAPGWSRVGQGGKVWQNRILDWKRDDIS